MTDLRRASRLAALLMSSAIVAAACGGTAATAAPTPTGEATPSPTPEATPTPEPTPVVEATPEPTPENVLPSFDLGGLMGNLAGVNSYRITVTVKGVPTYLATVVLKPDPASAITLGSGTDITKIIRIGDKAWLATGSDAYQEVPTSMVDPLVGAFDPLTLMAGFANGNIGAISTDLGSEQKNGINAHHYRIDSNSPLAGAYKIPAGAALDLWVADDGYLVAYAFTGVSTDDNVSIDISNVNDPANVVSPPS